jgi:hypothetical protein
MAEAIAKGCLPIPWPTKGKADVPVKPLRHIPALFDAKKCLKELLGSRNHLSNRMNDLTGQSDYYHFQSGSRLLSLSNLDVLAKATRDVQADTSPSNRS